MHADLAVQPKLDFPARVIDVNAGARIGFDLPQLGRSCVGVDQEGPLGPQAAAQHHGAQARRSVRPDGREAGRVRGAMTVGNPAPQQPPGLDQRGVEVVVERRQRGMAGRGLGAG